MELSTSRGRSAAVRSSRYSGWYLEMVKANWSSAMTSSRMSPRWSPGLAAEDPEVDLTVVQKRLHIRVLRVHVAGLEGCVEGQASFRLSLNFVDRLDEVVDKIGGLRHVHVEKDPQGAVPDAVALCDLLQAGGS